MRTFNNIASLIKNKRSAHPRGLSQTQLSNLLGYKNGQFISNVERGLCSIPLKGMQKAVEVLKITPEELREAMLKDYAETLDFYLEEQAQKENQGESASYNLNDLRENFNLSV
ncbi:MAG: helix-turn-helix transcriptional regulator [Oligoflexia bacterium]|nr:helix-turn-helix transcriptional regulator [Oligoflexia bacterium]